MLQKIIHCAMLIAISIITLNADNAFAANPKMHVEVGLNHFYKNRYLEAYREFQSAIDADPNYPEAHYNLGRVYKLQGFNKEALVEFQTAVQLKPDYTAAKRELETLKKSIEADIDTQLKIQGKDTISKTNFEKIPSSELEVKAQELLNKGKFDEAIKHYELLLKEKPNDASVFKMLGYLYYRQNKYTKSLESYSNASRLLPGDAEIPYAIGLIYMKTGTPDKAETYFLKAIKLYPKMVKAFFALGESYEAQGRIDDAVFQFKKCLELSPNIPEATTKLNYLAGKQGYNYFSRGSYYYQKGDYENALSMLTMARTYGSLTSDQVRQADEMINTCKYWVEKQQANKQQKKEMEQIRNDVNVGQGIKLTDVISNSTPYIGKAIEWTGTIEEISKSGNKTIMIINTNSAVDPESDMNYCFELDVTRKLPQDERISTNSEITVIGKLIKVNKIKLKNNFSPRRQPIVEASELTFTRDRYAQPLVLRF